MSFIPPNTVIEFLQNVPLDASYRHTLKFATRVQQEGYFAQKLKPPHSYTMGEQGGITETITVRYELTKQMYQRSGDNTFKVNIPADCLYDCNYCRYQNQSFSDKWFYAFVTQPKYINNHVSEVTITIDVMQTWFYYCTILPSFIDREHTATDVPGDNIVPETIEIGDEYKMQSRSFFNMNDMNVCILKNRKLVGEAEPYHSKLIHNIYTPARIETYSLSTPSQSPTDFPSGLSTNEYYGNAGADWIMAYGADVERDALVGYIIRFGSDTNNYTITSNSSMSVSDVGTIEFSPPLVNAVSTGTAITPVALTPTEAIDIALDSVQEDEIIMVYQYPAILGTAVQPTPYSEITSTSIELPNNLDGYTPKNKKLLTYPFVYMLADNNSGGYSTLRWEDSFATETVGNVERKVIKMKIEGVFISTPCVIASPVYYRGFGPNVPDYSSALVYTNFPQCAWSGDTFKAWWAQNKSIIGASILSGAIDGAFGVFKGASTIGRGEDMMASSRAATRAAGANTVAAGQFMIAGAAVGAVEGVIKTVAQINAIKQIPNAMHGQVSTDSINPATGRQRFDFYSMTIKREYAKIADDFFTKYGYAVHELKLPNVLTNTARPVWNYVKTVGCELESYNTSNDWIGSIGKHYSAPSDAAEAIQGIFDSGITFWTVTQVTEQGSTTYSVNVGNYSADNSPVSVQS